MQIICKCKILKSKATLTVLIAKVYNVNVITDCCASIRLFNIISCEVVAVIEVRHKLPPVNK